MLNVNDEMLVKRMRRMIADMQKTLDLFACEAGYSADFAEPVKPAVREAFARVLTAWGAEGQDWQRHGRIFFLKTLDRLSLAADIYVYARAGAKKFLGEPVSEREREIVERRQALNTRIDRYRSEPVETPAGGTIHFDRSAEVGTALSFAFSIFEYREAKAVDTVRRLLAMPETHLEHDLPGALINALAWEMAEGSVLQPLTREDAEMAIAVWVFGEGKGPGRPKGGKGLPPRWEFLAKLCAKLGLGAVDKDTVRSDWQDAEA